MRLHRFIIAEELAVGRLDARDAGLANQLGHVLRLGAGDEVVLCDGRGNEGAATIVAIGKAIVTFDVRDVRKNEAEPRVRVTLYCALLKRENFELEVQKAVETGVSEIVPIITARTIKQGLRMDRLARIAKEAAEQCGRGVVPPVLEPMTLAQAFDRAAGEAGRVMFFDFAGASARDEFAGGAGGNVSLFIGPEGGWTEEESEEARARKFQVLGLGARTLRAETAAIIATYLAANSD